MSFAKLCESWDHLEAMPFRDGMRSCNCALLSTVLAEAPPRPAEALSFTGSQHMAPDLLFHARGIDLAESYRARIRAVETRGCEPLHYR